jgi:hypothetical protein
MSETVVSGAFLRIGQNRIGFCRFLEFFFRRVVVQIFVGMVLNRQFAIRAFNFCFGRVF